MKLLITAKAGTNNREVLRDMLRRELSARIVLLSGRETVEVDCDGKKAISIQQQYRGMAEIQVGGPVGVA